MHEIGIARSAIDAVAERLRDTEVHRVYSIRLRIGKLVAVVPETLEFVWDVVRQGTIAEDAELHWDEVAVECLCDECGCRFLADGAVYRCPDCQTPSAHIVAGKELEVVAIEFE